MRWCGSPSQLTKQHTTPTRKKTSLKTDNRPDKETSGNISQRTNKRVGEGTDEYVRWMMTMTSEAGGVWLRGHCMTVTVGMWSPSGASLLLPAVPPPLVLLYFLLLLAVPLPLADLSLSAVLPYFQLQLSLRPVCLCNKLHLSVALLYLQLSLLLRLRLARLYLSLPLPLALRLLLRLAKCSTTIGIGTKKKAAPMGRSRGEAGRKGRPERRPGKGRGRRLKRRFRWSNGRKSDEGEGKWKPWP